MDKSEFSGQRFRLLDGIRGICVLGMVIYHTLFDIAALSGNLGGESFLHLLDFVRDFGASLFILISGFCFSFGSHRLKRFLMLFIGGLTVSAVTFFVMPQAGVVFGILTFMAVSGALMIGLDKLFRYIPPVLGMIISLVSFVILFKMNYGYLGTSQTVMFVMPRFLYQNYFTAFFGFPFEGFSSGDYYPLLPWLFIYFFGYFLQKFTANKEKLCSFLKIKIPFFDLLGRKSFYIYLAHQPIIFGLVWCIFALKDI